MTIVHLNSSARRRRGKDEDKELATFQLREGRAPSRRQCGSCSSTTPTRAALWQPKQYTLKTSRWPTPPQQRSRRARDAKLGSRPSRSTPVRPPSRRGEHRLTLRPDSALGGEVPAGNPGRRGRARRHHLDECVAARRAGKEGADPTSQSTSSSPRAAYRTSSSMDLLGLARRVRYWRWRGRSMGTRRRSGTTAWR